MVGLGVKILRVGLEVRRLMVWLGVKRLMVWLGVKRLRVGLRLGLEKKLGVRGGRIDPNYSPHPPEESQG
jgi:hypothetical protein